MKNKLILVVLVFFTMMLIGCNIDDFTKQNEYQVSYEENGGSIVQGYIAFEGESIKLPSITKEGYTFLGWFLDKDFTISAKDKKANSDITLYAKWEINKYKVIVDGKEYEVEHNNHITLEAPEKVGYTFIGWYLDSNFITKWNNEKIIDDITLYSRYEKNKYIVKFLNSDIEDIEVYYDELISKPNAYKEGYSFDGWYLDSDFTKKWDFNNDKVTSNITLYAKYVENEKKYTVTFVDHDGTVLSSQEVSGNTSATEPTEPKRDEYRFDGWYLDSNFTKKWDFDNDKVTSNITLYAKYTANEKKYTVTFVDHDGTVLSSQEVSGNTSATEPEEPERDGYRFDGWDKSFTNVTSDLSINAKYVQVFVVEFLDYDNTIIDIQHIDIHNDAEKPEDPIRTKYKFDGWDKGFTNVTSDLIVKAKYIEQYKVEFLDYDGTILKEVLVDKGQSATAPNNPILNGYDFKGWDKDYKNVVSDLKVTATYAIKKYKVQFKMPDGTNIGEAQTVEYGFSATEENYPEVYVKKSADKIELFKFTKWNKSFDKVTEDLVVEAIYEDKCTTPAIVLDFDKENNKKVTLYVYAGKNAILNGIDFTINYKVNKVNEDEDEGVISIDSVDMNKSGNLCGESDNSKHQYSINNNEKKFVFIWFDTIGKDFSYCSEEMTFTLSKNNVAISSKNFVIESCSLFISDDNESIKVNPLVIYN